MKNIKIVSAAVAALLAAGALAACAGGSDAAPADSGSVAADNNRLPADDADVAEATESDVAEDLENARQAVLENLEWGGEVWDQHMLADDVPQPTMKYGLLVVPFHRTDASSRVTRTVTIRDGNFVIEADSFETGLTWQIDQDGNITLVD
jgi:hypothetical protein